MSLTDLLAEEDRLQFDHFDQAAVWGLGKSSSEVCVQQPVDNRQ